MTDRPLNEHALQDHSAPDDALTAVSTPVPYAELLGPPLSTRALHALRRYGIRSWQELASVDEAELALLPNVGEKTISEIRLAIEGRRDSSPAEPAKAESDSLHTELRSALRSLGDRRRAIVIGRTIQQPPLTLQDLGDRFDLSRERVRQLEKNSLGRLRKTLRDEPHAGRLLKQLEEFAPVGGRQLRDVLSSITGEGTAPGALILVARITGYSQEEVSALQQIKSPLETADQTGVPAFENASEDSDVITILSGETALADLVTVRFASPVSGVDPFDGADFISNRHRVAAVWTRQDASETVFINEEGEILARWPTKLITSIEWPNLNEAGHDDGARPEPPGDGQTADGETNHRVGTREWLDEIKRRHPRAYEPWPSEEDEDLEAEFKDGLSTSEIATRHQRRPSAIRSRLRKLGLD